MQVLPLLVAIFFFLLGIVGTFLPILPGPLFLWVGMFAYGLMTGFENLTFGFYLLQGISVLLVMAVDYMATALGTRRFGGTKRATLGAVLGLFVGILTLGPAGIIFGPFLGALAGELLSGLPPERAIRSSFGALIGLLGGLFLKLGMEVVMIVWFFSAIRGGF